MSQLSKHLRHLVKEHRLLQHPYLEAAHNGRLGLEELRRFTCQEMFVSVAFPAMMAEVVCKIPYRLESMRYPLIVNMFEESGERDPENSHPNLLRKLALWLGATPETVQQSEPLPETATYLDRLFSLCRSREYIEGLTAIGYGNEYLVLFEYPIFKKACAKLGCPQKVLLFFDANIQADVGHTANIEKVIAAACIDSSREQALIEATEEALAAREIFYDGLCRLSGIGKNGLVGAASI